MERRRWALLAAPLVVAALATGCQGSSKARGTSAATSAGAPTASAASPAHPSALVADVGKNDGFIIGLFDQDGNPVTDLVAGTYPLTVHDFSGIHDFHLQGPGVDVTTGVGFTGDKTFTVTLKAGTYDFVCDPHAGRMHGSFTVA